jgi:hypothetical protein
MNDEREESPGCSQGWIHGFGNHLGLTTQPQNSKAFYLKPEKVRLPSNT